MHYIVRLSQEDIRSLNLDDITLLNKELDTKNLAPLKKIKRSSGHTEYVSEIVLKQLESDKKRKRNQKKLMEMRAPEYNQQKPSKVVSLLKRILK